MRRRLDWAGLMRLGLGRLGLAPATFWEMTPVELRRAAEGRFGVAPAPLGRAGLQALMARHPDGKADHGHG
ncbi:MAG: phage tail assembly chaperone [Rhodobacteraceae bacterium]|nr:MAG: phage tail assembly chaperone [Paracoccaceae bacterium]